MLKLLTLGFGVKIQGVYKWCVRLHKFIGTKVIATQRLKYTIIKSNSRSSPSQTLCGLNVCSICCLAHMKTIFDFLPNTLQKGGDHSLQSLFVFDPSYLIL